MRFRQSHSDDVPEINLIPLIDILLVMLIFLAATTTFMRQGAIKVILPRAEAELTTKSTVEITIGDDGRYALAGQLVSGTDQTTLARAIRNAVANKEDPVVVISADAMAPHQFVVNAMEAARQAGVARIQFATQAGN